jgi:catechol 2,3-dioxygenase-like lactoylglutathione lyase family enzyme
MAMTVEKISAITFRVANMTASVRFYRDVLGLEIIYGGEDGCFSSLRTKDAKDPILNLEQGSSVAYWGRMIFYVADVDAFWTYLRRKDCFPRL